MTPPEIDVARARAETPAVEGAVHLNGCGAALMPQSVLDATRGHLELEAEIGGQAAERRRASELERGAETLGALL